MRHSCSPTPLNHWQAHKKVNELLLYLNGKPVWGENCLEIFLSVTVYLMTSGQLTLNIGFYPKDNIKCVKVACTWLLTSNCIINYLNHFSVFHFASRGKRVTHFTKLSAKHATECRVWLQPGSLMEDVGIFIIKYFIKQKTFNHIWNFWSSSVSCTRLLSFFLERGMNTYRYSTIVDIRLYKIMTL